MLPIGLSILALALADAETAVTDLSVADDRPRMTSPYSIGLERVASRILFERCRVEMVGDSETNPAGVTTNHAESRFHHGVLRTFRPRQWRGCTIPACGTGPYSASGWYYQPKRSLDYREIRVDADGRLPANIVKRTGIGSPGIFTGNDDPSLLGFNTEEILPFEFTDQVESTAWVHRVSVPLGGRYAHRVWRSGIGEKVGPNQLLESGARIRWQAWQYVSDLKTPGPNPIAHDASGVAEIVDDVELRPTTPHPSFRWTDIGEPRREIAAATADRPIRTVWHAVDGTLERGTASIPPNTPSVEPLGPGVEVGPPVGETWGGQAKLKGYAILLIGGFAVERLDQEGLFVASLGNDGFRAVNHLYQPQDRNLTTSFHPGSDIFNTYTDDALLARYERFETDTVFILLGVNDSNHGTPSVHRPRNFLANVEGILDRHRRLHRIAQAGNDAIQPLRFVIFTQPDWDDGALQRDRISKYASALRGLPHRHSDVAVVDLYARWRDQRGQYEEYDSSWLADGAHPTRSGQDAFAEMAWSEIIRAEYGCDIVDPNGDGVPDCESCSGDLDANGVVDGIDFGIFLLDWGGPASRSDLNADGIVNQADLGLLLMRWGPCP